MLRILPRIFPFLVDTVLVHSASFFYFIFGLPGSSTSVCVRVRTCVRACVRACARTLSLNVRVGVNVCGYVGVCYDCERKGDEG